VAGHAKDGVAAYEITFPVSPEKVPCSLCREYCGKRLCFRGLTMQSGRLIVLEFQEFAVKLPVSANYSQLAQ